MAGWRYWDRISMTPGARMTAPTTRIHRCTRKSLVLHTCWGVVVCRVCTGELCGYAVIICRDYAVCCCGGGSFLLGKSCWAAVGCFGYVFGREQGVGEGMLRLKTGSNMVPKIAEKGEKGAEMWLGLELKLVADVGIMGTPNAGKSTLLSAISAAQPTIASYPFTTLLPNLGVVSLDYDATMVVADLPGLLEGAHRGFGFGHEFLRHSEWCSVLVHVVDGSGPQPEYEFASGYGDMYDMAAGMMFGGVVLCSGRVLSIIYCVLRSGGSVRLWGTSMRHRTGDVLPKFSARELGVCCAHRCCDSCACCSGCTGNICACIGNAGTRDRRSFCTECLDGGPRSDPPSVSPSLPLFRNA